MDSFVASDVVAWVVHFHTHSIYCIKIGNVCVDISDGNIDVIKVDISVRRILVLIRINNRGCITNVSKSNKKRYNIRRYDYLNFVGRSSIS